MTAVIRHDGHAYDTARAIDRALEGRGWRVVPMHAEAGQAIRICPRNASLFAPTTLVLVAGEQLHISDTGGLQIAPIPDGAS